MRNHVEPHGLALFGCRLMVGTLSLVILGLAPARAQDQAGANVDRPYHSEAWWREQAARFIDQIADDEARDRALCDFGYVRVRAGDLAGAAMAAPRIGNTELRVYAHLFIAKHYKLSGKQDQCLAELQRARPVALAEWPGQMINAYLDYAESPEQALAFVLAVGNQRYRSGQIDFLAKGLAQRGELEHALLVLDRHVARDRREKMLVSMAKSAASAARVKDVQQLVSMLKESSNPDAAWKMLVSALVHRGRQDEARQFVDRISDPVMRSQANAALGRVADVSTDMLLGQIQAAATRQQKQVLQNSLLNKLIAAGDDDAAQRTIESMVKTIKAFPHEPQVSAFGTVDDNMAIGAARSNYLRVARLLAEQGKDEASRKCLAKARKAIVDMPYASGIGNFFVVKRLVDTQLTLKDLDGARGTLEILQPDDKRRVSGGVAAAFIRAGDVDTAMQIAEEVLSNQWPGDDIGDIVEALIHRGELDMARKLLAKLGDSRDGISALRAAGSAMLATGQGPQLNKWLDGMTAVAKAYVCIGASEALMKQVGRPPASQQERAVVKYLAIPQRSLPAGLALQRHNTSQRSPATANPGVFRHGTLPTAVEHLQRHRYGTFVDIENAFLATYRNDQGFDVRIQCFAFADADTAQRVQFSIKRIADWCFRKDRLLVYVSSSHPDAQSARDAVQKFLQSQPDPWED